MFISSVLEKQWLKLYLEHSATHSFSVLKPPTFQVPLPSTQRSNFSDAPHRELLLHPISPTPNDSHTYQPASSQPHLARYLETMQRQQYRHHQRLHLGRGTVTSLHSAATCSVETPEHYVTRYSLLITCPATRSLVDTAIRPSDLFLLPDDGLIGRSSRPTEKPPSSSSLSSWWLALRYENPLSHKFFSFFFSVL